MKKFSNIRTAVAAVVFVVLVIGLFAGLTTGTLSGFGWESFSALCPLGAVTTMLATKTMVPRAVISLVIMAVLVLIFGRVFCGWICPVPVWERIKNFLSSSKKRKEREKTKREADLAIARYEISVRADDHACAACGACHKQPAKKLDTRHAVLGGALLSTAVFGFPVFCLVCPVGLSFATVVVLYRLFAFGDTTWSVILVPLLLVVEVFFLRKWCTRFCPLSALMNLVGRFSRTGLPEIDDSLCLETSRGVPCSQCATTCKYDINLRHPEYGELSLPDCARCMECVQVCPADAIRVPLVNKRRPGKKSSTTAGSR
ncbi:MAG: 4Fe-4S binding protein [Coriobacteriales bacterium]